MNAENYFLDLRDASLFGGGALLKKPGIPPQPKPYLADQSHYVAMLRNIPFPFEPVKVIQNWYAEMEEDVPSEFDYEAGIVSRNPCLMWFHILRMDAFFATDAVRLYMCLCDKYYNEEVDRIPPQPTRHIPPYSNQARSINRMWRSRVILQAANRSQRVPILSMRKRATIMGTNRETKV